MSYLLNDFRCYKNNRKGKEESSVSLTQTPINKNIGQGFSKLWSV